MRSFAIVAALLFAACDSPAARPTTEIPSPVPTMTASPSAPEATPSPTPSVAPSPTAEPAPRQLRTVAGISFVLVPSAAELYLDPAISRADEAAIAETIAADVEAVQREFDRAFSSRPLIYVYATSEGYATGLERIFRYSHDTAGFVAENSVSFFEPSLLAIAVNWEALSARRPVAAIRHELTHRITIDACTPRCDLVPAWLNEGEARLSEALVPGSDWRMTRLRYEAASMAATDTLLPLNGLVSQLAWNALTDWAGYFKYQEAARATELLRADIGGSNPIAQLYGRIRRGENVARAYAALTGRSFDDFVARLPSRMREGMSGPGLLTLASTPEGGGGSYLLYGFAPSSTVLLTLSGPRSTETWPLVISPFGSNFDGIGAQRARGVYTISVQHAAGVITANLTKSSAGAPGDQR